MQSSSAKMSVPPSEALKMINGDSSSTVMAQASSGTTGFTSVSLYENSTRENVFTISASTTSEVSGSLDQITFPSFAGSFEASCQDCTNIGATVIEQASGCAEGQTVSAQSEHIGPLGSATSQGSATCE